MPATIQSVGPPPERHADRVIAEMLQSFASVKAARYPHLLQAYADSRDGNPRAQARLARRLEAAGGLNVNLTPGKRGRYKLTFLDWTGWHPGGGGEIRLGDPIPDKPWIACWMNMISKIRGTTQLRAVPVLLITHHVLSRAAQRRGVRTAEDLMMVCAKLWNTSMRLIDREIDRKACPPNGWRERDDELGTVVFKIEEEIGCLIATTVF